MFLNDLYTIVKTAQTDETVSAVVALNAGHRIFRGHFPMAPVMPGAVQLEMVKELLERQLQTELQLKSMRTCKFLNVIDPEQTPVMQIEIKFAQKDFLEVVASGYHQETVYFKAQMTYMTS